MNECLKKKKIICDVYYSMIYNNMLLNFFYDML